MKSSYLLHEFELFGKKMLKAVANKNVKNFNVKGF